MDRRCSILPNLPRFAAAILVAVPLVGCSSGPQRPTKGPRALYEKPREGPPPPSSTAGESALQASAGSERDYRDPVVRAALREQALSLLMGAARSESAEERANALEGLGTVPARLEPLVEEGLSDDNLGVRAVAAMMVGRTRFKGAIPKVEPLLRDPSPMVRASALYALSRCGRKVDLTPLAEMLEDTSSHVRSHAAFLLGELGEPSALGPLREAAHDSMTRFSASDAKITQLQIAEARIKLGDDAALHEVRAALYPSKSEELEGTVLAAQIIGEVKDRGGASQLIGLTAAKDDSGRFMPAEVRLAAAGSLAKMGMPQGSFIARELRGDQHATVRAQAAYVFGETGQADNLRDLSMLLQEDKEQLVRVAAAAAILRITDGRQARG